jgi:hypothetical protein
MSGPFCVAHHKGRTFDDIDHSYFPLCQSPDDFLSPAVPILSIFAKVQRVELWANSAQLQALLHAADQNIVRFRIPRCRPLLLTVLHASNPNAQKERDQLKLRWGSETNCTGKPPVCFAPGLAFA